MTTVCPGDDGWAVTVEPCLADFGFRFENVIFNIVPAALFLLVALSRAIDLRRARPIHPHGSLLGIAKSITIVLAIIIDLAFLFALTLVEYSKQWNNDPITLWAAVLRLSTSLALFGTSWLEHARSSGTSLLLQAYLLLAVPLNVVYLRSLRLRHFGPALIGLFASHFFLRFVQLTIESLDKSSPHDYEELQKPRHEKTYGLFGYRKKFEPEDLIPLDEDLTSHRTWHRFESSGKWHDLSKTSKYALLWASASYLRWDILFPVIPYIGFLACSILKPFLVTWLLQFVSSDPRKVGDIHGYGLIIGSALVYGFAGVFQCWYTQGLNRLLLHLRDFLTSAIYQKTLALRSSGTALDEDNNMSGSPISLQNVDVERVLSGMMSLHELWGGFVLTIVGLYLLYDQIGWAFLAPLIIIAGSTWVSGRVGKAVSPAQLVFSQATSARIDYLTDVLGSMKTVKMLGLPKVIGGAVTRLRVDEINSLRYFLLLNSLLLAELTLSEAHPIYHAMDMDNG
ncbi:MAG: hypothetical protein Q9227_007702 [Pyrenula ochraceoflavens]